MGGLGLKEFPVWWDFYFSCCVCVSARRLSVALSLPPILKCPENPAQGSALQA